MSSRLRLIALLVIVVMFIGAFGYAGFNFFRGQQASIIPSDLSGMYDYSNQTAYFEGKEIDPPLFARNIDPSTETQVLGVASPSQKWVEVDLSEQKLKAWDGQNLFLETAVATGLPGTPTPQGEFNIWIKLRYANMKGGQGRYYYNLPNVPYVMYFSNDKVPSWKGYGLHGTYWHNSFGTPRSHGCVNLPTSIAEKLYYWTDPVLPSGKGSTKSTDANPGTRIVIHE